MEKSSLASILQRKKNKNLTLAHRQLWGMIDLVYKDFYDKESKIYDAGNVTREEFSIIKHVYKTRHVVNYTEIKALLNNKHLSHVGWVIKNLEKKGLVVNVNIRMYNFDDVQCTVIPSVAYGFVTGMNLQLC